MSDSPIEKRKEIRKRLIYYLKVFNGATGVLLGNLVDITKNGTMLISEEPIPLNVQYSLKIKLPRKILGQTELNIKARSLWSKNDINPVLFDSGFQFSKLTQQEIDIIEDLLFHTSFDD